MKIYFILFGLFLVTSSTAQTQHQVGVVGGYTLSKVRALFPSNHQPNFMDKDYTTFSFCHAAYLGVFYEYAPQKLRYRVGLDAVTLGASNVPSPEPDSDYPWYSYYLTLPLIVTYPIMLGKQVYLSPQVGLEPGLQWGNPAVILVGQGKYWGHLGLLLGLELEYKRWRLGVRGQYGLTDFLTLPPYRYRHTALTLYLGYTFYDSSVAQARRLNKTRAVGPRYGAAF